MAEVAQRQQIDVFVIGSGPAGQKAAIQAAKAGRSVVLCEQLREIGGACVQFGTIPSKTLRERALDRARARALLDHGNPTVRPVTGINIAELIGETDELLRRHDEYMRRQLLRNGIELAHGRAAFESADQLSVRGVDGTLTRYQCDAVIIATGSAPRTPPNVAVDHEHIYDSDSILSIGYLPQTMLVLGGGVIACEYASIFALLGVEVIQIDRFPMPLGFLDAELSAQFRLAFEQNGGRFIGPVELTEVRVLEPGRVVAELADGRTIEAEKAFCALGRESQVKGLALDQAGLATDERGLIPVTEEGRTLVPQIFAAGDVVGPPSLASTSMQQGRRAARALLDMDPGDRWTLTPIGIYAVPELGSIGLTEVQARTAGNEVVVGLARFDEIARGLINGMDAGILKLVADTEGRLLGAHVAGGPATELVHLAQLALLQDATVDLFVDHVFNFPTYAEAYRVAALDVLAQLKNR